MITITPRLGTLKLMQLTKNCSKEERDQLIEYIGKLETKEEVLLTKCLEFSKNFTKVEFVDPYAAKKPA